MDDIVPQEYSDFLEALKLRVRTAQVKAALSVNRELIVLYWEVGHEILASQHQEGWGTQIIIRLADDLRREFPEMKGFSRRNLFYMRAFAEAWPQPPIVQQPVALLPWGHNCVLLDKIPDTERRLWYTHKAIENGWSRNVLTHQIETKLYERQGKALTNFSRTLPPLQSDLANETLKDPYNFDFLTLGDQAQERDLENALLLHIRQFLLELGAGFAFVGSQHHLEVGGDDFYIDLLFYHLKLRCYVVIDLKMGQFQPEYAGKMNFYLSAVDDLLRHPSDAPSIGLILCKTQNRIVAEYALRDMDKPIGVSLYDLTQALPNEIKGNLPTIEEIEIELKPKDA